MQHVIRFSLASFLIVALSSMALAVTGPQGPIVDTTAAPAKAPAAPAAKMTAKSPAKPAHVPVAKAEYKRADMNFYWKADVLKADPTAKILMSADFTQKGDSYFPIKSSKTPPKTIYAQMVGDWVEPITPPNMPASLGVPPDAMQIREPQGDVQIAFPSAPTTFIPVKDGMTIPNGTVVKTGGNGTAAVLFGGVASARLAPNSEAAVQQTLTPQARSTEVDLTRGAVFSKVGKVVGETEDYKVHTSFGVASARGTDFVSVAMPARMDVWIAQGTVQLNAPDGKMVGSVTSDGMGGLKIIRNPPMPDAHQAMMADAETMTAAMNVIPMVNVKIKALRDKMAMGTTMNPKEKDYLGRIKHVPYLVMLALVEPPAPPPAPIPPPAPPVAPAPAALPQPRATGGLVGNLMFPAGTPAPIDLDLRSDGKVDFQGATLSIDELKPKLEDLAKNTPDQPIMIKGAPGVTHDEIKNVRKACHAAKLKNVKFDKSTMPAANGNAPQPTPAAMPSPQPPAPAPTPMPAPAAAPQSAPLPPVMTIP